MNYHCLRLTCSPAQTEPVFAKLYEEGCVGLEETETDIKAYFPESISLSTLTETLQKSLSIKIQEAFTIGLNTTVFKPAPYDPFPLADDIWIYPPTELLLSKETPLPKRKIIIQPAAAFGTGRHETTQLVAQSFLDWRKKQAIPPISVLDVGSGSGILAILAHQTGTAQVTAVEILEEARDNARENFRLNGCNNIALHQDIREISHQQYEVVLANILTITLLHLRNDILKCMKPGGILILSGVTQDEVSKIKEAYVRLSLLEEKGKNEWKALTLLHSGKVTPI